MYCNDKEGLDGDFKGRSKNHSNIQRLFSVSYVQKVHIIRGSKVKVKLFTHSDLDGVGCALLADRAYGKENVDITYCSTGELESHLRAFLVSGEMDLYDLVYITDISTHDEDILEVITRSHKDKVMLIDHHKTSLDLNNYEWCYVSTGVREGKLDSATSLFCYYLLSKGTDVESIIALADKIRKYDTWEWKQDDDNVCYELNLLLYLLGREEFYEFYSDWDDSNKFISECHRPLLAREFDKMIKYISNRVERIVYKEVAGHRAGICFAEQYINELSEYIYTVLGVDFSVVVNMGTGRMSFRTDKDIDLSVIAETYGGGGHSKSCGAGVDMNLPNEVASLILGV